MTNPLGEKRTSPQLTDGKSHPGHWICQPHQSTIYIDENDKEIISSENDAVDKKAIPDYVFVRTEVVGGKTIHRYKHKPVHKITRFVDENGVDIATQENGQLDKKDIVAYTFMNTTTQGDVTIHHYQKSKTEVVLPATGVTNRLLPVILGTIGLLLSGVTLLYRKK